MSDRKPGYAEQIIAGRPPSPTLEQPGGNVSVLGPRGPIAADTGNGDHEAAAAIARRQQRVRLNLVFKNGTELSLPYIHLMPVELDGDEITLAFPWYVIRLKGRNLVKLKRRLDLQIHGTIKEVDEFVDQAANPPKPYAVFGITKERPKDEF